MIADMVHLCILHLMSFANYSAFDMKVRFNRLQLYKGGRGEGKVLKREKGGRGEGKGRKGRGKREEGERELEGGRWEDEEDAGKYRGGIRREMGRKER